jgi:hypothetical protein
MFSSSCFQSLYTTRGPLHHSRMLACSSLSRTSSQRTATTTVALQCEVPPCYFSLYCSPAPSPHLGPWFRVFIGTGQRAAVDLYVQVLLLNIPAENSASSTCDSLQLLLGKKKLLAPHIHRRVDHDTVQAGTCSTRGLCSLHSRNHTCCPSVQEKKVSMILKETQLIHSR